MYSFRLCSQCPTCACPHRTYCLVWRWTSKEETLIKSLFHVYDLSLYLWFCFSELIKMAFSSVFCMSRYSSPLQKFLSEVLPATWAGRAYPFLLSHLHSPLCLGITQSIEALLENQNLQEGSVQIAFNLCLPQYRK